MATSVKSDVKYIAEHLSKNATYEDAMHELYVRMKIVKGKEAVENGHIISHENIGKRFIK